jgi:hypothetical protein
MYGDSRAAIVCHLDPLVVAAYTDELDCVVLLEFDASLVEEYGLEINDRLLTVNLYHVGVPVPPDIVFGERNFGQYSNYGPIIADFLTKDRPRIGMRKVEIAEEEWSRTRELAEAALRRDQVLLRDGRPLFVWRPTKVLKAPD